MELELRHLRYFVAVAEELHFGRAAERLHMAQPPLSVAIQRLEGVVGTPLLARTSRSVALTPAGDAFLARARLILDAAGAGVAEAARIGRGEAGHLDVGFVSSVTMLGVADRIQAYRAAFPEVRTQLYEGQTALTVRRLLDREIDIAIVRDAEPHPGLAAETLVSEPFVAVVPAGHPRARAKLLAAGVLRDEPFVFYPRTAGALAYQRNLQVCYDAGYEPRIVQEAEHWLTICHLVGAGIGVSVAPASAVALAPPTVWVTPLTGSPRSEVQLLTRAGDDRPLVTNFARVSDAR